MNNIENQQNQIAIIGVGVMGSNLARNFASKGIKTAIYDRTAEVTEKVIQNFAEESGNLSGYSSLEELVDSLETPRKVLLMITAGAGVDAVSGDLSKLMESGDIIIDGGNSNFKDTIRRTEHLESKNLHFVGCGISGGEKGALEGPSIMPGGSKEALDQVVPLLEKISAKDFEGQPCVSRFVGKGAGNFIKTVHNGIEYGIMQVIADGYEVLRKLYNLSAPEIADFYEELGKTEAGGFLLETTLQVLRKEDTFHEKESLVDYILDEAGAKGTGTWTVQTALEYGMAIPVINSAVQARQLSQSASQRKALHEKLSTAKAANSTKQTPSDLPTLEEFSKLLQEALWISSYTSYLEGIQLLDTVIADHNWEVSTDEYLRVWQGGCIIRSRMLKLLPFVMAEQVDPNFLDRFTSYQESLAQVLVHTHQNSVATPALSAAYTTLTYQSSAQLPTNLVQGLRDNFGAHTYKRTDREGIFTENWD